MRPILLATSVAISIVAMIALRYYMVAKIEQSENTHTQSENTHFQIEYETRYTR